MNKDEARETLSHHTCSHTDINNEKWKGGFLDNFRGGYSHQIGEKIHEVIMCLRCLADDLGKDLIDT